MREVKNVKLAKLIVHVLDNSSTALDPVLSNHECEITPDISAFFADHIERSLSDDKARVARFKNPNGLVKSCCEEIFAQPSQFIPNSKKVSAALFAPMKQMRQISSGDFAICFYSAEIDGQEKTFIGMLKMDFKSAYKHLIQGPENDRKIELVAQNDLLPTPDQRVQKCVFIRPPQADQYDMVILDNQIKTIYEAAGAANFFSKTFLEAELTLTDTDKTRLFRTLTAEWVEKNYQKLPPKQAHNITDTASESIRGDSVNVRKFADVVISNASLRQDYLQYLRQNRLVDVEFSPDQDFAEKVTKRRRYRADGALIVSGEAEDFDKLVSVNYKTDAVSGINRIPTFLQFPRDNEDPLARPTNSCLAP
jgi:hypothetical protein